MSSNPVVVGNRVKIPVGPGDKVIYLKCNTIIAGATFNMEESTTATAYTVPADKVLKIVYYQIQVSNTNCAVNTSYFQTSGGTQILYSSLYHTNANSYVQYFDAYTEVAAGNTIQYVDGGCGSTAEVIGVETDV